MRSILSLLAVLALLLFAPFANNLTDPEATSQKEVEPHTPIIDLSPAQVEALVAARTSGRATSQNWLHHVGGIGSDQGVISRLGPAGSLYVAGNVCHGAGTCSAIFGSTTIYANNDIFIARLGVNGTWDWIAQTTGSGSNPYAYLLDMEVDQFGNVFITGYFRYTKSFGSTSLSPRYDSSNSDGFLARISSTGSWSWAQKMGGGYHDYARGLALDSNQNIYVVGESYLYSCNVYCTAYFGSYSFNAVCSGYRYNGWIAKATGAGSFQWVERIAINCDNVYTRDVIVDNNSDAIVTGYFTSSLTLGSYSTTSSGSSDIFLAKISGGSTWQWLTHGGGLSSDTPDKLAVDANNGIYVVGWNDNHASYGTTIILANNGGFVVKAMSNGTWEWGTRISPSYRVKDIAVGPQGGLTVVGDRYITYLNSTGAQQWYQSAANYLSSVDIDSNGTAYITGYFSGSASYENFYLTSNGSNDLIIWRWDRDRDGDTVADRLDNCPDASNTNQDDYDGDTEGDRCDTDDDDDGFLDVVDNCPRGDMNWLSNASTDRDQDGCQDAGEDTDDDDDGVTDVEDTCHPSGQLNWVSSGSTDHDSDGCHDDLEDGDDDNDGVPDVLDSCAKGVLDWRSSITTDHDSDGCEDATEDGDDDNDGLSDWQDDCGRGDVGWTSNLSTDWDNDGCQDAVEDTDDDGDSALDVDDLCPRGVRDWTRYVSADYDDDGCRDSDEDGDDDNDGVVDHKDLCPLGQLDWISNLTSDNDADGCRDASEDGDDDNDGISDVNDFCAQGDVGWTSGRVTDHDSDGCNDNAEDTDDDGDGIPDSVDLCPRGMLGWVSNGGSDMDGDGCLDSSEDGDDDGDGVSDRTDPCPYDSDLQCVSNTAGGNVTIVHQYPDNSSADNATTPPTSTVINYHNNSTTVVHYYNNTTVNEPPADDPPTDETDDSGSAQTTETGDQTPESGMQTADLMAYVSAGSLLLIALLMLLTVLQLRRRNNEEERFGVASEFESPFDDEQDVAADEYLQPEPEFGPGSELVADPQPDPEFETPEPEPDPAPEEPQVSENPDLGPPRTDAQGNIGEDGLEWFEHPEGSGSFWYRENAESDWQFWDS